MPFSLRSLLRRPKLLPLASVSTTVTDSPGWASLTSLGFATYANHDYDPAKVQELYQDSLTA